MSHREGTGQTLSRIKIQSKGTCETLRGSPSKRVAGTVFIATADMNLEGGTAHAAADTQCSNKMGVYGSVPAKTVNQVPEVEDT